MELKNSVESIVDSLVDELLRSKHNICKCEKCLLDMKAYALNRLPPKYIVSERGLIHSEIENVKDYQFNADIIRIISESIDIISSKTRPGYFHYSLKNNSEKPLENVTPDFNFNFPHIIGTVYINEKFDFAEGIKIYLYNSKGELVKMAEEGWFNPYTTHSTTMGLYAFWPAPLKSEKDREIADLFKFKLVFEYGGYKTKEKPFQFRSFSERVIYRYIRKDNIKKIPSIILLK
jgi:competence protein ComFB